MKAYTTRDVHNLLGLGMRQVRDLARTGALDPERGPGGRYRFGFQDLVLLRTARALIDARVPHGRVVRALRRLREQLPAGRSITAVRIVAEGDELVVHDDGRAWDPESGQLHIAFDVAELADRVEPLARRAVDRADAAREGSPAYWLELAAELETHAPDQARRAYRAALELDPANVRAHANLGRLFCEQGATEAAIVHYRQALQAARGDDPVTAFNLGRALEDLGRDRAAADAYRVALAADPAYSDAHRNLARIYERI